MTMAKRRKKRIVRKHPAPPATERFNMVLDPELKQWATEYAGRRCTSVTAIIVEHLVKLRECDEGPQVEQI